VVGNKADLRIGSINNKDAENFAKNYGFSYAETSAKTGGWY
jgi:hypothetical protein